MGIERFRAALVIAQVQHRKGHLGVLSRPAGWQGNERQEPGDLPGANANGRRKRSELILKIAALLLSAALADLIIIRVFFG